jgi:methylated-DNA-[protein]-cysteine S-methyltransferase
MTESELYGDQIPGPLGKLLLIASDEGLRAAVWNADVEARRAGPIRLPEAWVRRPDHPILKLARKQLDEYFRGGRREFDVPLAPRGTPFQLKAWAALRRIPYGKTISYQEQALSLGGQRFARAVGSANRVNPISILTPCHRVVGKSGALTGFLYGTDAKAFLLELERS